MGFFDRFKRKKTFSEADITPEYINNHVFMVHLLMREKTAMPSRDRMEQVMGRHLGDVACLSDGEKSACIAVKKHRVKLREGKFPPQLMVTECLPMGNVQIDMETRSQMWDCPEHERILGNCKYHVLAIDNMASLLPHKDRAQMDMDFLEALVELYPQCEAVYIQNSGKMFTREQIANHQYSHETRYVHFAVNARLFNIEGTDERIVDTLGMGLLGLPDVQYHFHGVDPNWIVYHAYCTAQYIYEAKKKIKRGDPIDGIKDGEIDIGVQWKCNHEFAIMEPKRIVIDIYMNEYAAGKRM